MRKGFWKDIKRPVFVLAPMANVTDAAFRRVIAKYGKPDVVWTEFVSAEGLDSKGRDSLLVDLAYSESERPIVAQLFTGKPDKMEKAARLCVELGFDGIDINMGCPDNGIEKSGAGASLIKDPPLAQEVIAGAMRGAGELPVSVKTRLGYEKNVIDAWLPVLLETGASAITLHARTRNEMSAVPAHWEEVARAVRIRDAFDNSSGHTLILGNGDVTDLDEARARIAETGADGVMIGRGIFGNPWLWSGRKDISVREKLTVMMEHTDLFAELLPQKNFSIMKKHYKAYVHGWDGAKDLRLALMDAAGTEEVHRITESYLATHPDAN